MLRECFDQSGTECGQIFGGAAGDQAAIGNDFFIDPVAAGVFDIGPERFE